MIQLKTNDLTRCKVDITYINPTLEFLSGQATEYPAFLPKDQKISIIFDPASKYKDEIKWVLDNGWKLWRHPIISAWEEYIR